MTRYVGPKDKRERKDGRSRKSNFGLQLLEKQKLKWTYDVSEKQLRNYYLQATKTGKNKAEQLLQILERRLDNVVYRLGFTTTRAAARQLVNHSHIKVNQKNLDNPSYLVKPGDIINLTERGFRMPHITEALQEKSELPHWLDRRGSIGQIVTLPTRDQIPLDINESMVVEFLSG